ncbi:MAG: ammonia-forming cytochrome c nitrite reductase subunit c552 [Planctomycetes bacterium]|jgi:nitrite reductase (cytochrome c-552)|nr:ammonia-forming cytochrome c nitrite reductase subunit c552 [Planctomycetota bacterium]
MILGLAVVVVVLLGLLGISILERRWETQRPPVVVRPLQQWEPNNAVWGEDYPREYESYLRTRITDTRTKYGGSYPRDYLDIDPQEVILFAGYGFSKDYLQARGHYFAVQDVTKTARLIRPFNAATCWTCKSTDVPRLMDQMGVKEFYAANFHDLTKEVTHPIGCQDCHDPQTLKLRITRPALQEAFVAMGRNINEATHQEMRSLVCAQCHVEYYFRTDAKAGLKNYLVFPWAKGTALEEILAYYDALEYSDYVHAISGTPIVKMQHPDYELYLTGIHSYRNVSCADCHMPYRTEGGVKYTDHHVQSPLLNIANSCAVCHRWGEDEIRTRVEGIQTKVETARLAAEEALVRAHFDLAATLQAGASAQDLTEARRLVRRGQIRWDFIASNNGMGFHSPQESMRLLGEAANLAQQARVEAARLLAKRGITDPPKYPDISTRQKASEVAQAFVAGQGTKLLP